MLLNINPCDFELQGILEALEFLVENKYSFQRTFYIGFGHDEEVTLFYLITNYLSVFSRYKI